MDETIIVDGQQLERFPPGDQCGVCRFPVGPGQICGNPVYAVAGRGALPKYCGAQDQEPAQRHHHTLGDPEHRADRAGYARRLHGLTAAQTKELAGRRAQETGVHRHPAADTPDAEAQPPTEDTPTGDADTATSPDRGADDGRMRVHALTDTDNTADIPARLGEHLLAAGELAARMADELTRLRTDAENRVAREMRNTRAALAAKDRAEAAAAAAAAASADHTAAADQRVAAAQQELDAATAARLHAEGQLTAAADRIRALETAAAEAEARHRTELDRVREAEQDRCERILARFSAVETRETRMMEPVDPDAIDDWTPAPAALREMGARVQAGRARLHDEHGTRVWHLDGARATNPAARTLNWMLTNHHLQLDTEGAAHLPKEKTDHRRRP